MAAHVDSVTDISAILEQLRVSRQPAAPGDEALATRVATMNFIIFVDDPAHRQWVLERAVLVAEKHPSRLIVLDSTPATKGVDVTTSTRDSAGATVVNERVDIGVSSLDHAAIVSLTQELAVPDIPTVLWWSGARLLQSRTFSGLAAGAATVLVDSSGKARDEETIRELCAFAHNHPGLIVNDLAFMRLAPWQEIIAQFFDDPALREELFSIVSLEIESGSGAEALYLGGWLGSRLSWQARSVDEFEDRAGKSVSFKRIEKGDQRRVISVALRSATTTYRAEITERDDTVVCLTVGGVKVQPAGCVPLQNIKNTTLIERAILLNARDDIFETSLQTVRELLG